jgi:transcriptional regulator with XRE-family HTH domain
LTQQELATKFQRHQTTISKMEKGVIPVADNVARIIADVEVGEGARLAILRRRFKKTLAEAAMETGVHEHVLSEMERGLRDPVAVEYEQWIASLVS